MYNQIIINIFKELQLYWDIKGDTHRSNAYRNVVSALESYSNPILSVEDVPQLPGIGKRSIDKIKMIIKGCNLIA
jgi:DNA polymerase/3'-5' exonuclease PolX